MDGWDGWTGGWIGHVFLGVRALSVARLRVADGQAFPTHQELHLGYTARDFFWGIEKIATTITEHVVR